MTLRLISNTRASEPGTRTSLTASLGTWTYRVSPGLALVGLKVILFTVRSAFMALRTFSECEGSRLGGTAMVYNVFSKLICILVMAEGGYDPRDETTDKDPLIPGTGDDDDDDPWDNLDLSKIPVDPEEPDRTQPFTPGAASTPAGGESIPMTERTRLPQERGSLIDETTDSIPTVSEVDFVDEEEKEKQLEKLKKFIKDKFPKVDFGKLGPIGFGKKMENNFKFVKFGGKGGESRIIKADNSGLLKTFVDSNREALGLSAENIIAEDNTALQDTQRRLDEAQQAEARLNAQAQKQEQETKERQRLENQLEQINQRIDNMANEGGTTLERQMETDRLKRESEKLKRDIKEAKKQEKEYAQTAKEQDKVAKEVERLKRQY